MRIRASRKLVNATLRFTQCLFFAGAAVLLGYYGFVAADTWIFQQRESRNLQRLLKTASAPGSPAAIPRGLLGRLEIPRLGLSAILIEGDDATTLRRAVGHIPGTPLPGQPGNVAFSGHRDTFFRPPGISGRTTSLRSPHSRATIAIAWCPCESWLRMT